MIGLVFNIISPIFLTLIVIPDNLNYFLVTDWLYEFWSIFFVIMAFWCGLLLLISGVYLIKSVFKIKTLYQKNKDFSQELNMKALWLHAGAFSFYITSLVLFMFSVFIYTFWTS